MGRLDYAVAMRALLMDLSECGDIGFVREYDNKCFLALVDVLGHGSEARKVAIRAAEYLEENYGENLMCILNGLHEHLKGTRGAVVSLCHFDSYSARLKHVGIGNISVRIFGGIPIRLVSKDGIVGYGTIRPQVQELTLRRGEILLMHSDGIKEHFDVIECTDLLGETAESIAFGIMNRFGKRSDDSSCVVLKYLK